MPNLVIPGLVTRGLVTPGLVIIADDLSGAADCGIVCAEAGLDTVVMLGHCHDEPDVAVLAIDADTRSRTRAEAAAETYRLVKAHAPAGRTLFRKIDSTLRGHMAAELAATLAARRESGRALVLLAPAFPGTGRTTREGHQHLHGVKLEHTELWRREGIPGSARIPEMLAGAGLTATTFDLADIRGGNLERAMLARMPAQGTPGHDVMVFDAEIQSDLQAVAEAAAGLGDAVIWAGSAGLARHLPHVTAALRHPRRPLPPVPALTRPVLFVVGSVSAVSRAQVERLSAEPGIAVVDVPTSALRAGPQDPGWIRSENALDAALRAGGDVIVLLGRGEAVDLGEGLFLCRSLARLVAPFAACIGALVSTGGETARAVLQAVGASGLRLVREVETGVPISIIEGWGTEGWGPEGWRPIPMITKAGAFGTIDTLHHCRAVLHGVADPSPKLETLP